MSDDLSTGGPIDGPPWPTWTGNEKRRCTAHKKTGEQCRRHARRGTSVCDWHGAKAPAVQRKAKQRLAEASLTMAKELLNMVTDPEVPPSTKLKAITEALDRGGVTSKAEVEVSVAEPAPWQQIAGIARLSREESLARRGQLPPPRELTAADPAVPVDAEVVPDPNPPAQPDGPHYEPQWVQAAKENATAASSGGELLTMEEAARFQADLRRAQGQPRRVRSERFK